MKRLLTALGLISLSLLATPSASAASPDAGRLVRSPEHPAVYYSPNNGTRYAFPNERIFRSWGVSFDAVETISAGALAQLRLAGAIVYRPGRLIKIDTDPKVYLVTENGVLRWIETETVARALFGDAWARQVDDIPDAFFAAYAYGPSIANAATVTMPAPVSGGSLLAIGLNQGLIRAPNAPTTTVPTVPSGTPPTPPAPEPDILVRSTQPNGVRVNESVRIDVFGKGTAPRQVTIRLNGAPVQSCREVATCSYTFTHPTQSTLAAYQVQVEAALADGTTRAQSLSIPVRDPQGGALRLNLTQDETRSPGNIDLEAEWTDTLIGARSITLTVNGEDQRICFNVTTCRLSYGVIGAIGSRLDIRAITEDTAGNRWITSSSSVTVVGNDRPTLTVSTNAGVVFTGETIGIEAEASDIDAIAFVEIWENNERQARCERTRCSFTTPPQATAGTHVFRVVAQDLLGARREVTLDPILVLPTVR